MKLLGGFFAIIILFIGVLAYNALSWGLVVWKFWYWFLIPIFPAVPAITFLQAIGVMCFISLFKTAPSQILKDEYLDKITGMVFTLLAPWLSFLIGWIIKSIIF